MTTIFNVIGEHTEDPDRLLLLGADGLHYQSQMLDGVPIPVVLDDSWLVDPELLAMVDFASPLL